MKHIQLKLLALPAILALGLALAPAAHASAGTITFNGSALASTCVVSTATGGNGAVGFSSGNFSITLPGVQTFNFTATGDVADPTPFSVGLTGCPTSPSGEQVAAYFSGSNIAADGNLGNTGTASGLEIQLLNADNSVIDLSQGSALAQNSHYTAISATGTATLSYVAQYYASSANVAAGSVSTTVDYTLVYR